MSAPDMAARFVSRVPGQDSGKTPSITIYGVPASVERAAVERFLAEIGLDMDELRRLTIHREGIEVDVFASGPHGRFTHDGQEVAMHRLTIPVVEGPAQP